MSTINKPNPGRGFKPNPFFKQPFVPQKPGPHVADVVADKDLINKLFTSVSDGDIEKIKEVLVEYKIPLNVKNENGETLINSIMKIETITVPDKIELIEYLALNGVPLSQDNNGVTPLHIAAKYQDIEFVKSVIKNRHVVKAVDNKDMNAIHYAVMCNIVECEKPKQLDGIQMSPFETLLRQSGTLVIDMMNINPIQNYVKIISSSSKNFGWYKQSDVKRHLENHKEKILNSIGKSNLSQLTADSIKSTYTDVKQELTRDWKCFEDVEIDISRHNIWGPIKEGKYKLMKEDNGTLKKRLLKRDLANTLKTTIESQESLTESVNNLSSFINKEIIQKFYDVSALAVYYNIAANKPAVPAGIPAFDNNVFNDNGLNPVDILNPNIDAPYRYTIAGLLLDFDVDTPSNIVVCSKDKISSISRRWNVNTEALYVAIGPGTRALLADGNDPNVGETFYAELFRQRNPLDHLNNYQSVVPQLDAIFKQHTNFLSRFNYFVNIIHQELSNIRFCINMVNGLIQHEKIYIFTHLITVINISIFNILQNMTALYYYSTKYENNTTIINRIRTEVDKYEFLNDIDKYSFIYEQMNANFVDAVAGFYKVSKYLEDMYREIAKMINTMNMLIDSVLNTIGAEIVVRYLENPQVLEHNDVFDRSLTKLSSLPNSFADYEKLFSYNDDGVDGNVFKNNREIWQKYIWNINKNNYATYYNQNALASFANMNAGININATPNSLSDVRQENLPKTGFSLYHTRPNPFFQTPLPAIANGPIGTVPAAVAEVPHVDLEGMPGTLIGDADPKGYFGYQSVQLQLNPDLSITGSADTRPIHILGSVLGDMYTVFKTIIVKMVICTFASIYKDNDELTDVSCADNIASNDETRGKIKEIFNNFKTLFESIYTVKDDWEYYVYVAIGKITDNIITNMIKMNIHSSLSMTIMDELYNIVETKDHQDILSDIVSAKDPAREIVHILEPEQDIKFALDHFFKDLVKVYKDSDVISIDKLYPSKLHTRYHKTEGESFTLFSDDYLSVRPYASCYRFDPKIIEKLVSAGCNINQQDVSGNSPIFYAINMYNINCVKTLLDKGAFTVSIKNNTGHTPLTYILTMIDKQVRMIDNLYLPKAYSKKTLAELEPKLREYDNLVPTFIENMFEYIFVLCNFNIHVDLADYKFGWSIENENLLYHEGEADKHETILPFINATDSEIRLIANNSTKFNTLWNLDNHSDEHKKLNEKIKHLEQQQASINKRLEEFVSIGVLTREMTQEQQRKIRQHIKTQKQLGYIPRLDNPDNVPPEQTYKTPPGGTSGNNSVPVDNTLLPRGLYYQSLKLSYYANPNIDTANRTLITNIVTQRDNILNDDRLYRQIEHTDFFDKLFFYISAPPSPDLQFTRIQTQIDNLKPSCEYTLLTSFVDNFLKNKNLNTKTMPEILISTIKKRVSDSIKATIKGNYSQIDKSFADIHKHIDLMISYYDTIVVQLDMQKEVPLIYNKGNTVLDKTINNIIHVTRSTLCTNIYNTVIKLLLRNLEKNNTESLTEILVNSGIDPKEIEVKTNYWLYNIPPGATDDLKIDTSRRLYYSYLTEVLENILLCNNYKEQRLDKYILVDLPRIVVKILLDEYFYSTDIDKGYKNIDNALDVIKNILTYNSVYPIVADSPIIKTLDEYLLPYFREMIITYVPRLMAFINNYHNFIRNSHRTLVMTKILLEHSKQEYKYMMK